MHRYTQKPFPPYRYVPGQHPHPEIHPEGHSYGEEAAPAPKLPPDQWQKNELYLYGVDLFNHGYWWEAHEAWERCWLLTKKFDLPGQFLQGLIQFSAALLKLYSKNINGFKKLYREASIRLQKCCDEINNKDLFMGVKLENWLKEIESFQKDVLKLQSLPEDPLHLEYFPFIVLKK